MKITAFFKNAFKDMKESAIAQHEVDKANFNAIKAESGAQWEEAKALGNPKTRKAVLQQKRDKEIAAAGERERKANERIEALNQSI